MAATDPVRTIQSHEAQTPLSTNISDIIQTLGSLPASPAAPYLTVSIDWQPDGSAPGRSPKPDLLRSERHTVVDDSGNSRRPARGVYDRDIAARLVEYGPRGEAFESLSADVERIADYLDNELDPSAQGIFIVACSAQDVFYPVALSLPVPTSIGIGAIPALSTLAQLHDDHPTYAVLLADQKDATLSLISLARLDQSVTIESTGYPRHQQQGGWSQRRYQMRADERIAAFTRTVADETQRVLDEQNVQMLVLAGDEVITNSLMDTFHQTVQDRVLGSIRMDIRASDNDLIEATLPLIDQAERAGEDELVRKLSDALGAGNFGTVGVDATLLALQMGQVETLIIADDLHVAGWGDYELGVFGPGLVPSLHPAGGDTANLVPVSLTEELIRLAITTSAEIEFVQTAPTVAAADLEEVPHAGDDIPHSEAARKLDEFGGVGAILRFSTQPTDTDTGNGDT